MECCTKNRRCCCLSWGTIILLLGIGFLVIGFIIQGVVDKLINKGVEKALKLDYNNWDESDRNDFIETQTDYDFFAFNITNLDAALAGAKLNVVQVGPYHYRQFGHRFNITLKNAVEPDGSESPVISFNWWWHYNNLTSESDAFRTASITTVNPAYMGTVYGLKQLPGIGPYFGVGESDLLMVFAPSVLGQVYTTFTSTGSSGLFLQAAIPALMPVYCGATIQAMSNNFTAFNEKFAGLINCSVAQAAILANFSDTYSFCSSTGIAKWLLAQTNLTIGTELFTHFAGLGIPPAFFLDPNFFMTFFRVASNDSTYRPYALGGLHANYPNYFPGISAASSWADLGLTQYVSTNFSKYVLGIVLTGGYSTIDSANFNPAKSYLGPEIGNYNVNLTVTQAYQIFNYVANETNRGTMSVQRKLQSQGLAPLPFPNDFVAIIGAGNVATAAQYIFGVVPIALGLGQAIKTNGGLFTTRPAFDLAFGYPPERPDPILVLLGKTYPGLFNNHKSRDDGYTQIPYPYAYYTGEDNIQKASFYYAWRGVSEFRNLTDLHSDADCVFITRPNCQLWTDVEVIRGLSKNSHFGPFQEGEVRQTLNIYNSDLLRQVNFSYAGDSNVKGLKTRKYVISPEMLYNSSVNPNNLKYRMSTEGIARISETAKNMPLYISRPHFYSAPSFVSNTVNGLDSGLSDADAQAKYWTEIHVEPLSGLAVLGHKRLQISLGLNKTDLSASGFYSHLWDHNDTKVENNVYAPLLWADESGVINDSDASDFSKKIYDSRTASDRLSIAGYVVGACLIAIGLAMVILHIKPRGGETYAAQQSNKALFVGQ